MEIGQQPMMQSPETKIQPSTKLVIKLGVNNIDLMLLDSSGHLINFFKNDFEEKLSPEKLLDKLDLIINESNIKFSNVIEVNLVILNKLSEQELDTAKLSLEDTITAIENFKRQKSLDFFYDSGFAEKEKDKT